MRRPAALLTLLVALLASCATRPLVLQPRNDPGDTRTYRLRSTADTETDVAGVRRREHTLLEATSRVEVVSTSADGAVLRLTLTPVRFERDGRAVAPPAAQRAELVVGGDGAVRSIRSVGGLPTEVAGAGLEDLAPLLGAPLPTGRLHLGERWERALPPADAGAPGVQRGKLTALRVVRGYDCAIATLGTERPITRSRTLGSQTVRLSGVEYSTTQIAFALAGGFPAEIATRAEARLDVATGAVSGGKVLLETTTTLTLVQATG